MAKAADEPRITNDTGFDRFMRFGTALFAVPKDQLSHEDRAKKKRRKKNVGQQKAR